MQVKDDRGPHEHQQWERTLIGHAHVMRHLGVSLTRYAGQNDPRLSRYLESRDLGKWVYKPVRTPLYSVYPFNLACGVASHGLYSAIRVAHRCLMR